MASPPQGLEQGLAKALGNEPDVAFARLFGSRSAGLENAGSDVDLAVVLTAGSSGEGRECGLRRLEELLYERFPGLVFHMVDLATASPLLQVEIMTQGRTLLSGREGLEEELRLKALKQFFDAAPLYRARRKKLASLAERE